jgi:2'-5' RNA ligase
MFTATPEPAPFFAQTDQYVAAVGSVLRSADPILIEFAGVTASSGAIMIQGFCNNGLLNGFRDALRRDLRARGLAEKVDERYRLETAHLTVVRFRDRLRDRERLADVLEGARHRPFGAARITSLSLVRNDWYMTGGILETVKRFRLGTKGPPAPRT